MCELNMCVSNAHNTTINKKTNKQAVRTQTITANNKND